ncbi:HNH endonuclease [Delftia tsuruhatensis]|uniref:HNH endonuclease n=1 Tax=Delftia tsuruhatensis TaxID=180282 RepID=UPI00370C68E4
MSTVNAAEGWVELLVWCDGAYSQAVKLDAEDLEHVARWKWQRAAHSKGYVRRTALISNRPRKYKTIYLHRLITACPEGMEVDHINGDPLDNRRANLRIVTRAENGQNKMSARGQAGYRGVEVAQDGRFSARAKCGSRRVYLGRFKTPEEAAEVARKWRQEHMPFTVEQVQREEQGR